MSSGPIDLILGLVALHMHIHFLTRSYYCIICIMEWTFNKHCKAMYEYFLISVFMCHLEFTDPDPFVFCNIKSL